MKFKKNKVIISSLIGLTALTVCGVGFSAWVIGLNKPEVTLDGIGVNIDTITEKTFKSASENGLVLANGDANTTGDGIGAEFTDGSTKDLTVSLDQYDLAFASTSSFKSLTFDVVLGDKESSTALKTRVSGTDSFGRLQGDYTYIELKGYNNIEELKKDFELVSGNEAVTGYTMYRFNDESKALTFNWGTFFGGKEPATFYQEFIDKKTTTKEKLELMNQARTELNAMDSFFKNGGDSYQTITIKATLSLKETAAN